MNWNVVWKEKLTWRILYDKSVTDNFKYWSTEEGKMQKKNSGVAKGGPEGHGPPSPENLEGGERRTNNWLLDSQRHKVHRV